MLIFFSIFYFVPYHNLLEIMRNVFEMFSFRHFILIFFLVTAIIYFVVTTDSKPKRNLFFRLICFNKMRLELAAVSKTEKTKTLHWKWKRIS